MGAKGEGWPCWHLCNLFPLWFSPFLHLFCILCTVFKWLFTFETLIFCSWWVLMVRPCRLSIPDIRGISLQSRPGQRVIEFDTSKGTPCSDCCRLAATPAYLQRDPVEVSADNYLSSIPGAWLLKGPGQEQRPGAEPHWVHGGDARILILEAIQEWTGDPDQLSDKYIWKIEHCLLKYILCRTILFCCFAFPTISFLPPISGVTFKMSKILYLINFSFFGLFQF